MFQFEPHLDVLPTVAGDNPNFETFETGESKYVVRSFGDAARDAKDAALCRADVDNAGTPFLVFVLLVRDHRVSQAIITNADSCNGESWLPFKTYARPTLC